MCVSLHIFIYLKAPCSLPWAITTTYTTNKKKLIFTIHSQDISVYVSVILLLILCLTDAKEFILISLAIQQLKKNLKVNKGAYFLIFSNQN